MSPRVGLVCVALLACCATLAFAAARKPSQVRMFTAAAPCQSTQAAMWYFHDVKKLPASASHTIQTAANGLNVVWAYDASGTFFNGIDDWRKGVTDNLHALGGSKKCFAGLKAHAAGDPTAVPPVAPVPNPDLSNAGLRGPDCDATELQKMTSEGTKQLTACFGKLAQLADPNSALAGGVDADWKISGSKGACALACAIAIATSGLTAIPSCSVATEKRSGHLQGYFAVSNNNPAVLPAWITGHVNPPVIFVPSPGHTIASAPYGGSAAEAFKLRKEFRKIVGGLGDAVGALTGVQTNANIFPGFTGACSEDRILDQCDTNIGAFGTGFKSVLRSRLSHLISDAAELEEMIDDK